jgi:predicted  nucleic acid-binding Zn-ribbon protein
MQVEGMGKGETGIPGSQKGSIKPLSLNVGQLLEKVRCEIEKDSGELKKFLDLVESFRDIVPEEDKRYHAAMKALTHDSGSGKEALLSAADRRLSELENQKKSFALSLAGRRAEMKVLLAKPDRLKDEISRLKEELRRLEEEENNVLTNFAAEEKALTTTEEKFSAMAEALEKEILEIRRRITRYLFEGAAPPDGHLMQLDIDADDAVSPSGEEADGFEGATFRLEAGEASGNTKPCPNCRNQMNWYDFDKKWKCFVCAHEVE